MKLAPDPILVERYSGDMAVTMRCAAGHERKAEADETCMEPPHWCADCNAWGMDFKYVEAEKCPGCGTLGFYDKALAHCCSRRCMLQAEYAETLERG